jgi:O-antigen ligase
MQLESRDVLTLVRWTYWIIAFITTVILVSSTSIAPQLSTVMGISILVLAGVRLFEGIAFGRWGAWTGVQVMSQNAYGIQFSMFAPYAFMLPFTVSSRWRMPAIVGVIGMVLAIAGNGSRSSWIAVSIGLLTFFSIYAITQRGGLLKVPVLLSLAAGLVLMVVAVLPDSVLAPINDRFVTFERIEQDKSFAIRELMIQKGERLFLDSPLIGAGIGRFRDASVPLDIPQVLSYAGQDHFDVKSAHNSYIALLGETGLAGMVPYAILMLLLAIGGLRSVVRLARAGVIWPIATYASFIGMTVHLWALSGLTGTVPWFIYGLVAGTIGFERSTNPNTRIL